jgi:predicted GIY-YIG superfamily endonuclease
MTTRPGTIYLLHFDKRISERHTAQHYVGYTTYLPARALAHLKGRGARLTQIAKERGIGFVIARTWQGDRSFERKIKDRHDGPRLCPICRHAPPTGQLALDLPDEDLL